MKGHSGISSNVEADLAAGAASGSSFSLFADVHEHFLVAKSIVVSGNAHHFVRDIFWSICRAYWEAGFGCDVVLDAMIGCIDWVVTVKVWHSDSYMLAGFTSHKSSTLCTYFMKAVHRKLPVAIRKKLYNKCYPSVLCLLCGGVEFFDHAFTCVHESGVRGEILAEASAYWSALAGGSPTSTILEWYEEACSIFENSKVAAAQIVNYVRFVVGLHHAKVWLVRSSHRVVIEKTGLVCDGGVVFGLSYDVPSVLSDGIVRLLGVANFFAINFGCQKPFCFFSGLDGSTTIGCSIAVIKKAAKVSGSSDGFRPVLLRKKRRGGVLKDGSGGKNIGPKNLVNVSVYKSFALDIGLNKVVEKSFQEKLQVIRKLFSKINGFGKASTLLKFAEIIRTSFTFKSSLAQASKKAEDAKILVNTDLKKFSGHSDQTVVVKKIPVGTLVEAIYAALSEFGVIKLIKMQLMKLWQKAVVKFGKIEQTDLVAVRWSILIGKNAVHVAKTDKNKKSWNVKDYHRALFYTLLIGMNAHNI
ncbi:hypothetical protein G9A89_011072 [Geosiphon pyriformis]|nr:hypothetical protein G9A89_011072 [Geosiphon pyriformis]